MSETRSTTSRAAAPGGAAAGGPRPGLALLVLAAAGSRAGRCGRPGGLGSCFGHDGFSRMRAGFEVAR